ncbi:MAG: hypothetical protein JWN70_6039 [Planctomycetaceae bacterium]|nr:hypothetical protein [Planctomycetaceae bacterium]
MTDGKYRILGRGHPKQSADVISYLPRRIVRYAKIRFAQNKSIFQYQMGILKLLPSSRAPDTTSFNRDSVRAAA